MSVMVNITFIKDGNHFELPTTLNNNYVKASHKVSIRDVNKKNSSYKRYKEGI